MIDLTEDGVNKTCSDCGATLIDEDAHLDGCEAVLEEN